MNGRDSSLVASAYANLYARLVLQDYDAFDMVLSGVGGSVPDVTDSKTPREKMLFVAQDLLDKVR